MDQTVFILEMLGTIAFAFSGALVAIKAKMDLFGVIMLGVITATGGGILRDVVLDQHIPNAFVDPRYVLVAFLSSMVVFGYFYFKINHKFILSKRHYRIALLLMDTIGLGVFSVVGVRNAYILENQSNGFLCIFCGVLTGVGGGLLRDMIVNDLPQIFYKHIYASASIVGSIVFYNMIPYLGMIFAMWLGVGVVVLIRLVAYCRKWSLPVVQL